MSVEQGPAITPVMLAKLKLTLGDLPESTYDHETQTRTFLDSDAPAMAPDTQFDGEKD